jgi:Domain of unknown function (DUF3291)
MSLHHLAQLNIGRLIAPIDAPEIAEFAGALNEINVIAESSPGFVWRLKDEATNNATSLAFTEDPLLIPNLSAWDSIVGDSRLGAHNGRLHDPLAVDHAPESS